MIEHVVRFSVRNKLIVFLAIIALVITGIYAMNKLPVDAVPDITNNQVQVITSSPSMAPQEVEQFITFPVEMAMANIPGVVEIRSISRFGLSIITIVFEEDMPLLEARQFVKEQIDIAKNEIPEEFGQPEMMPITTGLGEIYQYTLQVKPGFESQFDPMKLRTIQDWIVKRQLMGTEGIIEVSSFGGYLKQYEVAVDPYKLQAFNATLPEVFEALERNNQNSGGSYIEKNDRAYYIRTEGKVNSIADIEQIVIATNETAPILVRDVATVRFGYPSRFGAMTIDGKGETVGGIALMLKGANSSEAIRNVQERVSKIQHSLPEGVFIEPYLDRSVLVGKAIDTVSKNLLEGGLIVIFVLLLLLGDLRAGLIVASVIPLSLLFAFIMMYLFGVSANLMSLGAIDFGIVVDGAVIIVEGVLHVLYARHIGKTLTQAQMDKEIIHTSSGIIGSAAFGVLIIIVVFVPVMALTGIEGKMFNPMAKTVSFAIIGALLLSITYVPAMSALLMKKNIRQRTTFSDRIISWLSSLYKPVLQKALHFPKVVMAASLALLTGTVVLFNTMGGEFIPTLDEGDLAMQVTIPSGSSLSYMMETTTKAETLLRERFPEVRHVVSKIGTAEIPTDPMAIENADVMIILKEKEEWVSAPDRETLVAKMKKALEPIENAEFDFTQPIQLRFNELISGAKTDIVINIFGEDLAELAKNGREVENLISDIPGTGDVVIEQTEGLPQLIVSFNRDKLAMYHLDIAQLNRMIRAAYAGENAGVVYEGEKRFDLTLRLPVLARHSLDLSQLFVNTPSGHTIPLSEVATVNLKEGPMQISRENASRRVSVGVNVRNRDIASYIEEVQQKLASLPLKPGYYIEYGGQFENLVAAQKRLGVAVPIALVMIFLLLYFAFGSIKHASLIYITVPLSAVGGVAALVVRGMPFSISAGIGFIALFGVAVLNGIVLISYFNKLREGTDRPLEAIITEGALTRLRPVLMTAAVASLGFLPMALSTSSGAEVQKPLASVVIGGLITATLLTLVVLPVMYKLAEQRAWKTSGKLVTTLLLLLSPALLQAQELSQQAAVDSALENNITLQNMLLTQQQLEAQKRQASSLGNTNVAYQYGQMNAINMDHYLEIEQEIPSPYYMVQKSREANTIMATSVAEINRFKRTLERDTRLVWSEWAYQHERKQLMQQQMDEYAPYLETLRKKVEVGEISKVELYLAESYYTELEGKVVQTMVQLQEALSQLQRITLLQAAPKRPYFANTTADSLSLTIYPNQVSASLLTPEQARINQVKQQEKVQKAMRIPNLSLGYFNQTLESARGFQGVKIGLSIPLLNRTPSSTIAQAKIQQTILQNTLYDRQHRYQVEYEQAVEKRNALYGLYRQHNTEWKRNAAFLKETATLEMEKGAIDYFRYVQAVSKSIDIELQRLELIHQVRLLQIEINFYTQDI